ncbi:hypothetical protein DITRI_Ditri02bG0119400 [Diplodiscus trichospermus]
MKRVFGVKKDKELPPSVQDASERINKRGDIVDEKLKKLDAELSRYKEQIKKTRPGPAQEAIKARAMRVLKQKRIYEGQRDMLYSRSFNLDQVASASEGPKDAQETHPEGQSSRQFRRSFFSSLIGIGCLPHEMNLQDEMVDVTESKRPCTEVIMCRMKLTRMKSWVSSICLQHPREIQQHRLAGPMLWVWMNLVCRLFLEHLSVVLQSATMHDIRM